MPITTALAVSFAALALVALVQHIQIRRIQRQIREGFQRTEDALNKKENRHPTAIGKRRTSKYSIHILI